MNQWVRDRRMEEGADNSNLFIGGSSGAPGSDVIPEEGRIAGFDFLDPRKPGYLARSRFKPSLRAQVPFANGSRTPRKVWPRLSSMRRYLPVSVLTVLVYVLLLRMMLLWTFAFDETGTVIFWRSRAVAGVSMLGWLELLNVAFIVWVGLDFFIACLDRRRPGLGQKVGYVSALVLLGILQLAYNRLDYATDYLQQLAVKDDLAHPLLMLRIPPEQRREQSRAVDMSGSRPQAAYSRPCGPEACPRQAHFCSLLTRAISASISAIVILPVPLRTDSC
jgi:hypothetical protein